MNLLLAILIAVLVVWGIYLFLQRAPKYGPGFLVRLGLFLAFIAIIVMALTGRMHWLLGVLAGLLPLLKRLLPVALLRLLPFVNWPGRGAGNQGSAGQHSEVSTQVLKMILDHDSGDMDGEVLEGPYQGQKLSDLTIDQLAELHQHCQQIDHEAMRLLESYLHRHREEQWRSWFDSHQQQSTPYDSPQGMSVTEALEILELEPEPSEEEIHRAHKKMMAKFHPDRGGSHYMAVKINQAKDLLLSRL